MLHLHIHGTCITSHPPHSPRSIFFLCPANIPHALTVWQGTVRNGVAKHKGGQPVYGMLLLLALQAQLKITYFLWL